ncbi:MAG: glucosamine-6-phosphate deaminase [Candidatus Sumerlaeia bacterium]
MEIIIENSKIEMGKRAAHDGAETIRQALQSRGEANIILATGASQFEMLDALLVEPDVAWDKITVFHLDEYVNLPVTHAASFRLYLWKRFHSRLPVPLRAFHYLDGERKPEAECKRMSAIIREHPIDVAFVGIGENGHLAFNDPPADFETEVPYLIVKLDEACRAQQMGEGWFATMEDVPRRAISMSIRHILKSKSIVCTVPDKRKAQAVKEAVEGSVSPQAPASILQRHPDVSLYLDRDAASYLSRLA